MIESIIKRAEQFLANVDRQWHSIELPWIMFQSWSNLFLASWPVPAEQIRPLVPPVLELDSFNGQTWISIVPFQVVNLHFRDLPPMPGQSSFFEINLRTYVTYNSEPGVYFITLDCTDDLAVKVAQHFFELPFWRAQINIAEQGDGFRVESSRDPEGATPARLVCDFEPAGETFEAASGSLESWLADRYALFLTHRGDVHRGDIKHAPWIFKNATANFQVNTIAEAAGLKLPDAAPHILYAASTDTFVWPLATLTHSASQQ